MKGVLSVFALCCFFFQAEDGIRDHCVTGVQTCALPISSVAPPVSRQTNGRRRYARERLNRHGQVSSLRWGEGGRRERASGFRSEERRVGKECRYRWAQE